MRPKLHRKQRRTQKSPSAPRAILTKSIVPSAGNSKGDMDVEGGKLWLEQLYQTSGASFNMKNGRRDLLDSAASVGKHMFRAFRKCAMKVVNIKKSDETKERQPGKNTDCMADIRIRIETPGELMSEEASKKRQEDAKAKIELVKSAPFWFRINFEHNHYIKTADHQKFRSVSQRTKEEFNKYFENDFTASAAWNEHRKKVKYENPETWPKLFGDRNVCPDYLWSFKYHQQWCRSKMGTRDGIDAAEKLEDLVKETDLKMKKENSQGNDTTYIKMSQSPAGETVVVICDPFMRRVHSTIPQCGDLLLLDATSNLDRSDSKLFHFITPSSIG